MLKVRLLYKNLKMYVNRKVITALPAARERLAQAELIIAVGERIIIITCDAISQLNAFGNLLLMKKSVIAISADVMKMNQKELEEFVIVVKIPWRPPAVDAVPPMSAKVQAMNTSDRRTKATINAIIRDLTRTMPDIVSSKVLGSSNIYKVAKAKAVTIITNMFNNKFSKSAPGK